MLNCDGNSPTLVRVVELVQSAWGDWWIVHDGTAVAVHLRSGSSADAHLAAVEHAKALFPDEAQATQAFRAARWTPAD